MHHSQHFWYPAWAQLPIICAFCHNFIENSSWKWKHPSDYEIVKRLFSRTLSWTFCTKSSLMTNNPIVFSPYTSIVSLQILVAFESLNYSTYFTVGGIFKDLIYFKVRIISAHAGNCDPSTATATFQNRPYSVVQVNIMPILYQFI